jgi:PAS domain S-box-containing protein
MARGLLDSGQPRAVTTALKSTMGIAISLAVLAVHALATQAAVRLAVRARRFWAVAAALALALLALSRVTPAYEVIAGHGSPNVVTETFVLVISLLVLVALDGALGFAEALERNNVALRRSQDRYRAVAESTTDAIVIVDARGRVTYANPAVEALFGYSPGDLFEHPAALLAPRVEKLLERVKASRGSLPASARRLEGRHKDGRRLWLDATFREQREGDGILCMSVVRDGSRREPRKLVA